MPQFQPFRGIHYDTVRTGVDVSPLVAPPYDVIDPQRRAALAEQHQHNAVHLTLPVDHDSGDRYRRAAALLDQWISRGVLVVDERPSLYRYRVDFVDEHHRSRTMTGVIGCLGLDRAGHDVLPHERTMPKPKGDRLELLRATRANLEPIFGLSLASGLSELLAIDTPPLAEAVDTRGARHQLSAMTESVTVDAIRQLVASHPVVIADGHHRYETSLHYQAEREAEGEEGGGHDSIMALVVELTDEQLAVHPIHRVIRDVPDRARFLADLDEYFERVPAGPNAPDDVTDLLERMEARGAPVLADPDQLEYLMPRPGRLDRALVSELGPVRAADAAVFEAGIAPLVERHSGSVTYRHDLVEVASSVRKGDADLAVMLRPVDVPTIRHVAEARGRMPQKTTFFHPKPSSGLVLRSLDH